MIRVFGGFGVPCEGGVFWWWGVWFSVEGRGCGGSEALNPSSAHGLLIKQSLKPSNH